MPYSFARSGNGDRPRAWSMAAALLGVLLLLTSGWLIYAGVSRLRAGEAVSREVGAEQRAADTLLSTLKDAETGQRGYLLTGEAVYLEPFDAAQARGGTETYLSCQPHIGDRSVPLECAKNRAINAVYFGRRRFLC